MIWTTRHLPPRHQCSTARASSRHQCSGDGEEFSLCSGKRSAELHLLRRDPPEISAFSFVCVRDKRRRHQDRGSSTADQQRRRNFPSWTSVHLELDCSCSRFRSRTPSVV
ncbi:hypothetical protein M6B38_177610 [Iris pallida]|uniref:Uncharacterized protein n=1 Tax=Iris pallida TaxID=29817 RepID=A0AAX6EPJ0_IRIPA|nr:hypothetical protein M6B38_177610 [Iris pallida]